MGSFLNKWEETDKGKFMILDLTHSLHQGMTVYPGTMEPTFDQVSTIKKDGFAELTIKMCSHTGTHIDAPCHVLPKGKSLDQFPICKFVGRGILVDVKKVDEISLPVLKSREEEISQTDFILFRTGWQDKWSFPDYFEGFPTLTIEAVKWLAGFDLKAIGFDAISADKVSEIDLPNHHVLLDREILIVENLTNMEHLPNKPFDFHCIPLKIANADGAPVRAYASLNET